MTKNKRLSMPFWCVSNPVGDPFGPAVMDRISSVEVCDLLCKARGEKLIDFTSAHDDDLVAWDPRNLEDDLDQSSPASQTLRAIKEKLEAAELKFMMITCGLHNNPVFRNGGLTNPNPEVRMLAARKVMRTIRIGNYLGAEYLTYWVARDGFETQFAVPWERSYRYLIEGLNLAEKYAKEQNGTVRHGTIEPKPNEPRGEMFLPTTGHALGLIAMLSDPSFWGVNPEILQHEGMTNLSAVVAVSMAAQAQKLFFLHVGNQKPGQFDNDMPVLVGMDGLKEMVAALWLLDRMSWNGHVEFDNHILRTDTAPGKDNATRIRMDFIRQNVENYRMAERKAHDLGADADLAKMMSGLWDREPGLARTLSHADTAEILRATVDYERVNGTGLQIGRLDQMVNRRLLGL
ncbi:MAG TPA: TIM barrel protein [Spirochaetia bacterium]|nr:TIM barrel protein [Spirochaetia bacterium]